MVFIWGFGSSDRARMGWHPRCQSFSLNYNSQEAPGAPPHSPRDVTAALGEGCSAGPARRVLGGSARTSALALAPR